MSEQKVNLIFAIPESSVAADAYVQLVDHLEHSSHGTLSSNCSNIVDIIRDNYQVRHLCLHSVITVLRLKRADCMDCGRHLEICVKIMSEI